ncbi:MAG: hypothetical protein ACMUHU_04735 [Thermoplasmatota archaeon]
MKGSTGTRDLAGLILLCSVLVLSALPLAGNGTAAEQHLPTRSGITEDHPDYHPDEIILSGSQERVLGRGTYGNITISGNSTLKVLGTVVINGMVKVSDNAVMNVTGSEMDIRPPPIGVNDNVMRVWGNSRINIIKGSKFRVFPQPVTQIDRYKRNNASFIEVDDHARILVEDSIFTAILPGDVVPEEERVTGGTILITGYSEFISRRSTLNAYLNYSVHDDGSSVFVILERWFWMSIQRFGTILVEDSTATLHEPGQTLFKPTNGRIILRNSTIYGNVRPETISTFEISNCEIFNVADQIGYRTIHEALEFNDHASGIITNTLIHGDVKTGWSSTNEFLGKADNDVVYHNCTFDSERILSYSNTSMLMDHCRIVRDDTSIEITDNSVLELIDTDLKALIVECGIHPKLVAIPENVTLILDKSHIGYIFNPDPDVVFNFHLKNGSRIDLFNMHFSGEFQNKTAKIILEDGSTIGFNNTRSGTVELILRNTELPPKEFGDEFTIIERYHLEGKVNLNGEHLEGATLMFDIGGNITEANSDMFGRFRFEYDTRITRGTDVLLEIPDSGNITTRYLGLERMMPIDLRNDNTIVLDLEDGSHPVILETDWSPKSFDQQKYITVSSVIADDGSGVVSSATLQYRRSGGTWINVTMFNVEGSTFEGVIPRSKIGQRVDFRIVAVDGVGNVVIGPEHSLEIGEEFIVAAWSLLAVVLLIAFVSASIGIFTRIRNRGFIKAEFRGDRVTLDDFREGKVKK